MVAFSHRIDTLPGSPEDTTALLVSATKTIRLDTSVLTIALSVPKARRVGVEAGVPLLEDRAVRCDSAHRGIR